MKEPEIERRATRKQLLPESNSSGRTLLPGLLMEDKLSTTVQG
jgi:hypothetical protein